MCERMRERTVLDAVRVASVPGLRHAQVSQEACGSGKRDLLMSKKGLFTPEHT